MAILQLAEVQVLPASLGCGDLGGKAGLGLGRLSQRISNGPFTARHRADPGHRPATLHDNNPWLSPDHWEPGVDQALCPSDVLACASSGRTNPCVHRVRQRASSAPLPGVQRAEDGLPDRLAEPASAPRRSTWSSAPP